MRALFAGRRAALFFCALGLCLSSGAQQIPAVHAETLSGVPVDLPQSLKGHVGVLVLGFSQGSREQVTEWGKRLTGDYFEQKAVAYYEMPVVAGVPRILRGIVVNKIAQSVSDRGKVHFVPVADHEAEWRSLAGYSNADDAYTLVVDQSGRVRWKVKGAATDATYRQVKEHVEALVAEQQRL